MKTTVLFALALCLGACGRDRSRSDDDDDFAADAGGLPDGDVGDEDAAAPDAGGGGDLAHYDPCTRSSECPAGDSCSVPATETPVDDPTAPKQCRPPCSTDPDCSATTSDVTPAYSCAVDDYCMGYCAGGGMIPDCLPPYACHRFPGFMDGYCAMP